MNKKKYEYLVWELPSSPIPSGGRGKLLICICDTIIQAKEKMHEGKERYIEKKLCHE